jgi:hypothetical protein
MTSSEQAAAGLVRAFLQGLEAPFREVAEGEFGASLEDVGGWPLELGVRVRDGLVAAQAEALAQGHGLDLHALLHRNRIASLARFAHSSAGALHVHVDLPADGLTAAAADRALGELVQAVLWARYAARRRA